MAVRLFVGNLSYGTTEADLRTYFGAVAPPSQVVLPVDRETGRPRGFAFVEFLDRAHAEEAIQRFNGQPFNGRPLAVSEARAREDRGPAARGRAALRGRARAAASRRARRRRSAAPRPFDSGGAPAAAAQPQLRARRQAAARRSRRRRRRTTSVRADRFRSRATGRSFTLDDDSDEERCRTSTISPRASPRTKAMRNRRSQMLE